MVVPNLNKAFDISRKASLILSPLSSAIEDIGSDRQKLIYLLKMFKMFLMIKVHKNIDGLSLQIMDDTFKLKKDTYNLRKVHFFNIKILELTDAV